MHKPYDITMKQLIEQRPLDWLRLIGLPLGEVSLIDADISSIIAEADKLLRVNAKHPYIAHLEMQSSYKTDMAERFMVYNVNTGFRTGLPVLTIVFLLRPEADGPVMRQPLLRAYAQEEPYHRFQFRVVRLWREPVEKLLKGGLGTLPLTPLCATSTSELPEIVRRMERRIEAESEDATSVWMATYLLMGLRYDRSMIQTLLKGVSKMRESVTYQAIFEEGEASGEARGELKALLIIGRRRLGNPSEQTLTLLRAINSPNVMESLIVRAIEVESWDELISGI